MTITVHPVGADMFKVGADAEVNPINTVGDMGAGLAALYARRYPSMNAEYKALCLPSAGDDRLTVGKVFVWKTGGVSPSAIINLPTKDDWRDPSELQYVESGIAALVVAMDKYHLVSVVIPALGCGLGGLEWDDVYPIIVAAFAKHPHLTVHLFPPH